MVKYFKSLWYVLKHKYYVFIASCKIGVAWRGLIHDGSKFSFSEFGPYARNFFGKYMTLAELQSIHGDRRNMYLGQKLKEDVREEWEYAWNHHQKCNKHHWNYWCLIQDGGVIKPLEMPKVYVKEMVADWTGAGLAQGKGNDIKNWYNNNKHKMVLHESTRKYVEELIFGEEK